MRSTLLALALIAAAALVGCGGGGDNESSATPTATATAEATQAPASSGGGATLDVSAPADGSLKFDQSSLSAKAGKVDVKFANPSSTPHAVEIEGNGVEVKTNVITNGNASVKADLKPGTYEYYCPVAGHRAAGMEGKLTVK
jgi:plastocyanin